MRNAGSTLWNFYKNNELGGDAIETLGYAGLSAAGQAMFTDMEADQIATATAVGAAAAMASRQPGRMLGGYFGKMYDDTGRSVNPVLKSLFPVTRDGLARMTRDNRTAFGRKPAKIAHELAQAQRNRAAFRRDGTERGDAETMASFYAGNRADNVAQALVALAAPGLLGVEDEQS